MVARGFTLVEVLVALVVLEVGLLGVAGTLFVASRTVAHASLVERGVGAVEQLVDSLTREGEPGAGSRGVVGGVISWTVDADGAVSATFTGDDGAAHVSVRGRRAW